MPDSRLVLPYDVEGVVLDVLTRRHPEHLAKVERDRGLAQQTFERFQTRQRMSDAGAIRLAGDTVPCVLVGTIGVPVFRRNEEDRVDATLSLGMQVTVMGNRRRDVVFRRDVMAWTVVECVYQRVPRGSGGLVHSVRLTDYEPLADGDTQRTVGDARLVWEVGVTDMLAIGGGLPVDTSDWPAEAGGAPLEPYDPVPSYPAATPGVQIDKVPLVE